MYELMAGGTASIVREIMENGNDEDRMCLDYVLHGRTGDNERFDIGRPAGLTFKFFCQVCPGNQSQRAEPLLSLACLSLPGLVA